MADNLTTTTTVATIPNATKVAARDVTYSGDASSYIAPVGIVVFAGSDDAKTATDIDPRMGDLAHDAADGTSNPLKVGHKAIAFGANPTGVAAADRTDWYSTRAGVPFVLGGHPNVKRATYLWTASTTDDNVLPAIAGGTKYVVTSITIVIEQAVTVGVAVRLGFGTANVPALPTANADAVDDILVYHPGLVPGSGMQVGDGSGILGVGADGAELRITAGATTGGTGVVTIGYFTIES